MLPDVRILVVEDERSLAAALQRGRSVVTITVTRQGARTSYSVVASLHTGQE